MTSIKYQFKYMPLVGKLPGKSMAEQTETAINEIAHIVNENVAQAGIINTLAEEAKAQSDEALEKATEALETSGRVYIKETSAVNLNDYCESQLIYIGNVSSTNLPVLSKGFLEVKTNDDKSQATQVFVDDTDRNIYVRTGAITATTVGDVTTYTASYGDWVQMGTKAEIDLKAPIDSPALTGTPTAPTPANTDNSTKISTTAFVENTFFDKLVAKLASATAASISSLNTSSLFYRMLSWALTASGVQYNFTNSSAWYICFGSLLGGLIIQGGEAALNDPSAGYKTVSLPLTVNTVIDAFSTSSSQSWLNQYVYMTAPDRSAFTATTIKIIGYALNLNTTTLGPAAFVARWVAFCK